MSSAGELELSITLPESIYEFMRTDKIKLINVAFLLENTPIEVVYIKLPEIRTFKLVYF